MKKRLSHGHAKFCDCDDCKRKKVFVRKMGASLLDRQLEREETRLLMRAIREGQRIQVPR